MHPTEQELRAVLAAARWKVKAALIRSGIPPADSEDVVQEALVTLVQAWGRAENKESFLLGTVRIKIARYWRDRRRRRLEYFDPVTLELMLVDASSRASWRELRRRDQRIDLRSLAVSLAPEQRRAIALRYGLGLGVGESARLLGYERLSSVQKLCHRAVERLRYLAETMPQARRRIRRSVRPLGRAGAWRLVNRAAALA
ncbi:MAG TPA: sigma-70 family RNA polymerase sigma factor [Thermoanaerobaculia bacterium]|nr:sigma-70 family RNA polymerase sigma factor [Thermoanaerobaculia bacterium]